ncbi:MAG: hypothetical protein ACRCSV_05635 [Chlamydiales bacterium]
MRQSNKRYITLIEVLLSFGLIAIIVGSLLMYLRRIIFLQAKLQVAEKQVLSRAHIQQQLHYLFSHIEYGKEAEFFTSLEKQEPELHFYFDNKVDIERLFSGKVKGIIRRKEEELVVEIRPLFTDQVVREWVIARGINSLAWRFISFNEGPNTISSELWPRDKHSYPDIFSLIVEINGNVHTFPIFLFKDFAGISYSGKREIP